jgi:DNA-binding response OmpR family regulator
MPGDRAKSLAAGADDHITKPVDTGELLGRIRYWLSRRAGPARPPDRRP